VLRKNLRRHRFKSILVMETAENWFGSDAMSARKLVACRSGHAQRCRLGDSRTKARVGATPIVMRDPLAEDLPQMPLIERNEMVQTFATR
jgi:hypothetical protein